MSFHVFLATADSNDAVLSTVPEDGPIANYFHKCAPVKAEFPDIDDAVMCFDLNYPEGIKLNDVVVCLDNVYVFHKKLKGILDSAGVNAEWLQVILWDHKNRPVSDEYFIFNCLESVDFIDMDKSEYSTNPLFPGRIKNVVELVVKSDLEPTPPLFSPKNLGSQLIITDELKSTLESEGITGYKTFDASGWDGLSI